MPADALFGPSLSSEAMLEAVSETAWVQAMLDVEAALARAEARVGIIPSAAAEAIATHCHVTEFDIAQIGREAVKSANPAIPLVAALRARVGNDVAAHVHRGATSQDVIDTAMMLIARRGLELIVDDLRRAAGCAAILAERHRSTLMAGRTLMQQALVTTFGLKAAGWLIGIIEAGEALLRVHDRRLAIQLGGAVGTLASFGDKGPQVMHELAISLRLAEPVAPWHSNRTRVAELGSALAIVAGVAGKVALDVVLLAQTEVGEVSEGRVAGRGTSSAMPQKHNPVDAVEILAAVRGVNAQAGILVAGLPQEHERAAGAWQAEWPALSECLRLSGGASSRLASLLGSLEVDEAQMRRNLDLSGGLIMSEQLVTVLSAKIDPLMARRLVDAAVATSTKNGMPFKEVVQHDPEISSHVDPGELAAAFEPQRYLGVSSQLIDRALAAYR